MDADTFLDDLWAYIDSKKDKIILDNFHIEKEFYMENENKITKGMLDAFKECVQYGIYKVLNIFLLVHLEIDRKENEEYPYYVGKVVMETVLISSARKQQVVMNNTIEISKHMFYNLIKHEKIESLGIMGLSDLDWTIVSTMMVKMAKTLPSANGSGAVLAGASGGALLVEGEAIVAAGASSEVAVAAVTAAVYVASVEYAGYTACENMEKEELLLKASKAKFEGTSKAVEWTNHGFKHFAPKNMSWKNVVKSTKNGPAKYLHGTDIEALERMVWEHGTDVADRKTWKVMGFDDIIGATTGKETKYMRVEFSSGTIHGHPITKSEYNKLLK